MIETLNKIDKLKEELFLVEEQLKEEQIVCEHKWISDPGWFGTDWKCELCDSRENDYGL